MMDFVFKMMILMQGHTTFSNIMNILANLAWAADTGGAGTYPGE